DELVCPLVDPGLLGVSAYFAEFPQVDDDRVRRLLSPEGRGAG
ncbi:MAG: phosphoribosyltransferase, partial [Actinobacteria bacterium]|nr:phosphoribosyltransferase [Actinomycetota bacterium]NIU66962.1 phosphoribosyltransferase [Actinomycetota bacterium]NIV87550.1 phosphoribosyltransferase [Actinomycetota bacterium]NIW28761.1 phosphoribosyltransferase [Actinomycetota bacterium]NIX21221.1 phosphoribosyltransferase [Actinomycetota bacterium]